MVEPEFVLEFPVLLLDYGSNLAFRRSVERLGSRPCKSWWNGEDNQLKRAIDCLQQAAPAA